MNPSEDALEPLQPKDSDFVNLDEVQEPNPETPNPDIVGPPPPEPEFIYPFEKMSVGTISIPKESIYFTSMLCPLAGSAEEYDCSCSGCVVMYLNLIQSLVYTINILAQIWMVLFIGFLSNGLECVSDTILMWISSLFFYTLVVRDFKESVNMIFWIYYFPKSKTWKQLTITNKEPREIAGGMRLWYKYFCILVFVIPKMAIIILLGIYGGSWLFRAQSNQDLILNCVALFFITEIDEMFNKNLVPSTISKMAEELPDINWPFDENGIAVCCSTYCGTISSIGVIVGVTAIAFSRNCGFDYVPQNGTLNFFHNHH